jgi:hypothetical protein
MADYGSRLEAEYVKAMYGVETILFNKDMALLRAQLGVKRFDVAFSNPPYNDNVHLKILSSLIGSGNGSSIAKEYVVVHPANWLIDLKGKENLFINFKNLISNKLNSVKIFNGNIVFGIGLFYPCVITHVDNDHSGNIGVDYFGDKYTVDSIYRITKYGKDWDTYVSSFYGKVKSFIKDNSSVWDHNKKVLTSDKEYCQLAGIRGNVSKDPQKVCGDDFYTLVMQNSETNKGVRKVSEKDKMPVFEFNSVLERDNFISYLKTDFARFCLAFYKVNQHTDRGEMEIIPWIDFTQEWDDEKLFNHFDINKETQDYIRKFLPDYYGIRK